MKITTFKKAFFLFIICMSCTVVFSAQKNKSEKKAETKQADEKTEEPSDIIFVKQLQELLNKNDLNGALALYAEMPEELEENIDLKILYASLLLSANKIKEASEVCTKLTAMDKTNIEILELCMQITAASGNKQKIKAAAEQILKIDKNNTAANIVLGNQYALNKKYKIAAACYKKALINEPNNEEALFGCGKMSYYASDLKTARNCFQKLLKLDARNSTALSYMGKLSAEAENYFEAEKYIKQAIAADTGNYDFYIDLGQYQRSQGKFSEAEKSWTKAISLEPEYFLAYTYRAGIFDEQNRFDEALNDYRKIIEINPKYYFAYEAAGILEFHAGNWEKAIQNFTKAYSIGKSASYQLMIIASYLKANKINEAKLTAKNAMKELDHNSLEYKIIRIFHDQGGINAEKAFASEVEKESDKNKRGKMMYYFALYYELKGISVLAEEYYTKILNMQAPMFFEYRLAEWGLKK